MSTNFKPCFWEDTSFIFLHPLVLSSQQDVAQCARATANFQLFLRTGTAQLGCGRTIFLPEDMTFVFLVNFVSIKMSSHTIPSESRSSYGPDPPSWNIDRSVPKCHRNDFWFWSKNTWGRGIHSGSWGRGIHSGSWGRAPCKDVAQCARATANFQLYLRTGTAQLGELYSWGHAIYVSYNNPFWNAFSQTQSLLNRHRRTFTLVTILLTIMTVSRLARVWAETPRDFGLAAGSWRPWTWFIFSDSL